MLVPIEQDVARSDMETPELELLGSLVKDDGQSSIIRIRDEQSVEGSGQFSGSGVRDDNSDRLAVGGNA